MRLFLPPSETKALPARGRPLDLDALFAPHLAQERSRVLDAAAAASRDPRAQEIFSVSEALMPLVERNAQLREAPTAPASAVYTGVLYEALGVETLSPAAKRRARSHALVFSALFGAVSLADRIPAYRASGGTRLPAFEGRALNAWWRPRLAETLDAYCAGHLVVDARSGAYASMYAPDKSRWVTLDVLQRRGEKLAVVSHFAKHTRGEVARALLEDASAMKASTPGRLAEWAAERWDVDLVEAGGRPASLKIILPEASA